MLLIYVDFFCDCFGITASILRAYGDEILTLMGQRRSEVLKRPIRLHERHRLIINQERYSWVGSTDDFENIRDADDLHRQINFRLFA